MRVTYPRRFRRQKAAIFRLPLTQSHVELEHSLGYGTCIEANFARVREPLLPTIHQQAVSDFEPDPLRKRLITMFQKCTLDVTIETQVGSFFVVRSRSLPALLDYLLGHRCRLFTVLAPDVVKRAVSVHMTEQLTRLICGDETVCRPLPCEIDTAARWRWRIVYNSWMNKKAMAESGKATCAIKQERPQLVWRSVHPPH